MAPPLPPRIVSRNTSSEGILSSTSPGTMRLLPLIPWPLIMVLKWPKFLLAEIPWFVMTAPLKAPNNLLTLWLTTFRNGEPWTPSSVMVTPRRSPRKSLICQDPCSLLITILNPTTNTRTNLNNVGALLNAGPTLLVVCRILRLTTLNSLL